MLVMVIGRRGGGKVSDIAELLIGILIGVILVACVAAGLEGVREGRERRRPLEEARAKHEAQRKAALREAFKTSDKAHRNAEFRRINSRDWRPEDDGLSSEF